MVGVKRQLLPYLHIYADLFFFFKAKKLFTQNVYLHVTNDPSNVKSTSCSLTTDSAFTYLLIEISPVLPLPLVANDASVLLTLFSAEAVVVVSCSISGLIFL